MWSKVFIYSLKKRESESLYFNIQSHGFCSTQSHGFCSTQTENINSAYKRHGIHDLKLSLSVVVKFVCSLYIWELLPLDLLLFALCFTVWELLVLCIIWELPPLDYCCLLSLFQHTSCLAAPCTWTGRTRATAASTGNAELCKRLWVDFMEPRKHRQYRYSWFPVWCPYKCWRILI